MNYILIVFVKNPVPGKVKTRVAATVGDEKAAEVYKALLNHTQTVILKWQESSKPGVSKKAVIYYGDYINDNDLWSEPAFEKKIQIASPDLGVRMLSAFEDELSSEAPCRAVIIGSDCLALRPEHLEEAFAALEEQDIVIGPADDGGYYLLGMGRLYRFLFENKPWSRPDLLEKTLADLKQRESDPKSRLRYHLLETLSDIDTWEDYVRERKAADAF
ncbi:MAG: TIGR04282 family arsenosugar biosynthesis glycosyltransferase [Spirosomataceae bacterium]